MMDFPTLMQGLPAAMEQAGSLVDKLDSIDQSLKAIANNTGAILDLLVQMTNADPTGDTEQEDLTSGDHHVYPDSGYDPSDP